MAVCAFAPADVATLLERLTAEPPDGDLIAALMDRTGGNPFYTTAGPARQQRTPAPPVDRR